MNPTVQIMTSRIMLNFTVRVGRILYQKKRNGRGRLRAAHTWVLIQPKHRPRIIFFFRVLKLTEQGCGHLGVRRIGGVSLELFKVAYGLRLPPQDVTVHGERARSEGAGGSAKWVWTALWMNWKADLPC